MSAVYVFGAGASIHANYPLAPKMGQGLLEFMLKSENNDFQVSAEQLIEMFGNTPNIEDLISEIEARIDELKSRKTDEELVKWVILISGRSNILRALREWFRVLHCSPADLYENFSQKIANAGDTVITFNYDDSVDRELRRAGKWELSTGYGFPFGNAAIPSAVQLLKVHGSSNWIVSLGGGLRSGFTFVGPSGFMGGRPVIHTVDAEYLGYTNFSGNTYPGGGTELSMILPGRTKKFYFETSLGIEFKEFWDGLWSQSAHALKRADKVVICGYSMPKADVRARELLLKHTNKKATMTVVSGADSERIAIEFQDAGYKDIKLIGQGYFEDWIEQEKT
ncbi:MAG: hypothetical protein LAO78_06670 [Acidobacteriia bacterium]|nr:hypothetical protein [Terriglobia bacterium]